MKYLIFVLSLFCMLANAVDITTKEGVLIVADSVSANRGNGTIVYSGNVIVKQNGMEFKADEVNEYRKDEILIKLVARGEPTVFIDKLASEGQIAEGTASTVLYIPQTGQATLTDYELISNAGSTTSGAYGVYLLDK